jgi:RNA polymerase sigma-70 factor (ECF subfamily)
MSKSITINYQTEANDICFRKPFIEQVNKHHISLINYAYAMTGNIVLAQDLVQETYLRAWAAHRQLKDLQFFKTWITTILVRESARWYAKGKYNLDDYDDELYSPIIDLPVFELDDKDRLLHFVKALPKLYRDPMWLFLQGDKCEDIAIHLQLNLNTVLTRLKRARGHIFARIEP